MPYLTFSPMAESGVAGERAPSGTVTFFFSDIEGSTQRWAHNRAAMEQALRRHDRSMREHVTAHGGHVFKTIGDAFCVAFATPEAAAAAALDAQRALLDADFSDVDGLRVRMAINTGTADERDGDYFGPALNRVARLLPLAHGGQILLSNMAAGLVRENPPPGVTLTDLGEYALEDLDGYERVYQLVAPDLPRDFPELHASLKRAWLVPDAMRTRYFTGRNHLLTRLRQQLMGQRRVALSGLGGVGKTQVAIEYAARHRVDYPDGVFWVNAATIGGLTRGFVEIATMLRLPAAGSNDQEHTVRSVLEWLNGARGWLLIFDNVEERADVASFLPARDNGHILITSRETVFQNVGIARGIEVGNLDGDEALQFLFTRTGRDEIGPQEQVAAAELVMELGNLPLALEQAAAYVTETNAAFSAYLSAFRKRRVILLEKAGQLIAHDTVAATWAPNFEAVRRASPAAADVLHIAALLAADAIPFELFLDGAPALGDAIAHALADPDDLAMAEVLRPLARYSLIRFDAALRVFSVHRLVQEIVWTALPEAERRTIVARAVCALDTAFPEVEFARWPQCERLVPHVASIARWLASDNAHSEAAGRLLNATGRYLWERGRYAEAQPVHERALAIRERSLGPDHPDVARSLNNLANVHYDQGRYEEARGLHERALALRERVLGADHPDVAISLNNLANVHYDQGRYGEARGFYERALAIRERSLVPDHPDVATSLSNLASVDFDQGRYSEARVLYERALAIKERVLGHDHPFVARDLNNLGNIDWHQGRYGEARALYERALVIGECALGPDHPDVAYSLDGLGKIYARQGEYVEAEALHKRALAIRERVLGPDHPVVARSLGGLGKIYAEQQRYAQAQTLHERALAILERARGRDHIDLAEALVGLASMRKEQGRNAEALALYERAMTINERAFTPSHPELQEIRNNIEALHIAMAADAGAHKNIAKEH